jgi:hypothetical protein
MNQEQTTVAFAMGGLAGNNAHGAGFLQAALDQDIQPIMISCTSGQILWVSRYLQAANSLIKGNLEEMLREDVHSVNPTGNVNLALASLALYGKPGVFAPARSEYMWDMVHNAMDTWRDVCMKPYEVLLPQKLLELFPCRNLLPDFPEEFFEKIADSLRDASLPRENGQKLPVGIVFNSYNPRSGEEYVYLNDQARKLLQEKSSGEENKYSPGIKSTYRDRTIYQNIDAKAVRDALWLYQYGFDKKESGFIDGAYFRGMILSELTVANRIFCVRPINHLWQGDLPRNYPELEDLKTEIGFDGSYCGERYQIELINRLLGKNVADDSKYHKIELEEIEIKKPRGYFDYLFENEQVFTDAYEDAKQRFNRLAAESAVPA